MKCEIRGITEKLRRWRLEMKASIVYVPPVRTCNDRHR